MGFPAYYCHDSLRQAWPDRLRALGCTVSEMQLEDANELTFESAEVSYRDRTLGVTIEISRNPRRPHVLSLFERGQKSNQLLAEIEILFLAQGAQTWGGRPLFCTAIYYCSDALDLLQDVCASFEASFELSEGLLLGSGMLVKNSVIFHLTWGSIDRRSFISVDFGRGFLNRISAAETELFERIDNFLMKAGAQRIEIINQDCVRR